MILKVLGLLMQYKMASFSAQRAPNSLLSTLLDTLKYNLQQKYWSYKNFLITIRSSAVWVPVSLTAVLFQRLSANSCCSLAAVSATSVLFSGIICRLLCWWQLRSQLSVPHLFYFQGLSADCCVGGSFARSCQCHICFYFRDYLPTAVLVAASLAAVSATAAFMLILGVRCQVQSCSF